MKHLEVQVKVTQQHLDKADELKKERRMKNDKYVTDPFDGPIALAIQDTQITLEGEKQPLGDYVIPIVGYTHIEFISKTRRSSYRDDIGRLKTVPAAALEEDAFVMRAKEIKFLCAYDKMDLKMFEKVIKSDPMFSKIKAYDPLQEIKPFTFKLRIPYEVI